MAFWLARHAQPLVAPGICYGRTDMKADSQATQRAATTLAAALPSGMPEALQIVTSPLQRCTQLALAVQALRPESTLVVDSRLAEMDFGSWEGQAWAGIDAQALQAWTDNFADYPAGEHGESVRSFMARIAAALPEPTSHHVLWVTHAGVERAVSLLMQGVCCPTRADQWPRKGLGFGEWRGW